MSFQLGELPIFSHYLKKNQKDGKRSFADSWYHCSSWSFWAGSGSHSLCWDLFLTPLTHNAFLRFLQLPMKMRTQDFVLAKGRARSGPYIVVLFPLSQDDQMFSAWFHLYCIVCLNKFLAIFPVITSEPHGLLQPGSPQRGCISMEFVLEMPWAEEWDPCCCPSKGPTGCCELLHFLHGDPFPAQGSSSRHSEAGVTCASLSGRAKMKSLRNHLHSLAFKLLTKHNALPRKACLLLTWKLIY